MRYYNLGRSGLKVSRLCLGCMMFGKETEEVVARRILNSAFERGVNFVDTANVYHFGESEKLVGSAIAARRDDWVLATKAGNPMRRDSALPHQSGASRKHILQSVEDSLRRLGTDYIDLFYLHREDHETAVEETVSALGDLVRQGKIRYYGLSNHRGWKIAEMVNMAKQLNLDPPVAIQPLYNIFNRQAESEQFTAADYHRLGIVTYSPLARGVLTGKYLPEAEADPSTRAGRKDRRIQETEWRQESLALAQRIAEHARSRGTTPAAFALAWVLNNGLVTSAIVGPRTEEQWSGYFDGLNFQLTPEDEALVDNLVKPGHGSTHGYNDPAHFVSGRPTR